MQGEINCLWYPRQFLSGSAANPVSKLSLVHPPLTMEGAGGELEGQEDTAQQGLRSINRFVGQDTGQRNGLCMCGRASVRACVFVCVLVFAPKGQMLIENALPLYIIQCSSLWSL